MNIIHGKTSLNIRILQNCTCLISREERVGASDWVFQTGCFAPGSTRNVWGTSRPCLFQLMAVKSKPPALRVVVDSNSLARKLWHTFHHRINEKIQGKAALGFCGNCVPI